MNPPMRIVYVGLSITSSWGNGHATSYRALLRALRNRGHRILFLERDVPWYAAHRDLPSPTFAEVELYESLDGLRTHHAESVREADAVVIGSSVPEGAAVASWVLDTARAPVLFHDLDTPVTLASLDRSACPYLVPDHIPRFSAYLASAGGPTLRLLEDRYRATRAVGFYSFVEPAGDRTGPPAAVRDDLGYLGTYSDDRQPVLERLLIEPARLRPRARFVVAGRQYPEWVRWPPNVRRLDHLPPTQHAALYCSQRFTLNVTRPEVTRLGYSPGVRLFEAAACGTPVISDGWDGIEDFFTPGEEILLADSPEDVTSILDSIDEEEGRAIGAAARRRVLREHTAEHRAVQLERLLASLSSARAAPLTGAPS